MMKQRGIIENIMMGIDKIKHIYKNIATRFIIKKMKFTS